MKTMILRPHKTLDKHIDRMLKKGFNSSLKITNAKKTKGIVLMKLQKTPLSYMYGWESDEDYWIISEN